MKVSAAISASREKAVWEMRCQSIRQNEIATRLGLGESTVSEILARVRTRMLTTMTAQAAEVQVEVHGILQANLEELHDLYVASGDPAKKQRLRRRGGLLQQGRPDGRDLGDDQQVLESQIEERKGAVNRAAILQEIRKTAESIAKLWGVIVKKVAPTSPDGRSPYVPEEVLSDDERLRRMRALITAHDAPLAVGRLPVVGDTAKSPGGATARLVKPAKVRASGPTPKAARARARTPKEPKS